MSLLSEDIIVCENLVKIYKTKDLEVLALQGLEINIAAGELLETIGVKGNKVRFEVEDGKLVITAPEE